MFKKILLITSVLTVYSLGGASLWAMPSQITFQGTLKQNGTPVNSPPAVNLQFNFVDGSGGNPIPNSKTITKNNVTVTNGLFSVQLDMDPSIPWQQYTPYIRVSVGTPSSGFQQLSPDQPLTENLYSLGDVPEGVIVAFAGSTPPPGWLICDGSPVSRTAYSGLFQAIGTTWGSGDGGTTFNLPDLRGRAPIGAGQGTGLTNRTLGDETIGEETHTLNLNEMPVHNHSASTSPGAAIVGSSAATIAGASPGNFLPVGPSQLSVNIGNAGGGAAHNNMQPSAVTNFIVKY